MKKQETAAVFYFYSIATIAIIAGILLLTSCGTRKSCHGKKYYVNKSIVKAQSKRLN